MNPTEVLRFAKHQHRDVWRYAFPKQADNLRELLTVGEDELTDVQITRYLNGDSSEVIEVALGRADVRMRIAARFGLTQMFNQADMWALQALFLQHPKAGAAKPAKVDRVGFDDLADVELGPNEQDAIGCLGDTLTTSGRPLISWFASFDVGARFCIHGLTKLDQFRSHYKSLFIVRPSDREEPFTSELRLVGDVLRVSPSERYAQLLLDGLRANRSLLVLCGVECLSDKRFNKAVLLRTLLQAARQRQRAWQAPSALMVVGASGFLTPQLDWALDLTSELEKKLAISTSRHMDFFHAQWLRFCRLRSVKPEREIGARLYHAQWHYDGLLGGKVWPINLRLRAYFASNLDNHAFFDPTGGFEMLGGRLAAPADICMFKEDIIDYLSDLPKGKRDYDIQLLRFMSTAKFWLTRDAFDILRRPSFENEPMSREMSWTRINTSLRILSPPIVDTQENDPAGGPYVLGIGVRAIVQDLWKREDPGSRSLAHYRIAERLFIHQNDKVLLKKEFPFAPHYGRSRMYFISECIRHLMRASDGVTKHGALPKPRAINGVVFEVDPPSRALKACDPRQVINFCYRVLYQMELDGRQVPGGQSRLLAKRHGAYPLVFELLQLMSEKDQFGTPHWALAPELHRDFRLDAGFAALNVGELIIAETCFGRLVTSDRDRLVSQESEENARMLGESQLNLSLVYASQNRLDEARQAIANAISSMGGEYALEQLRPSVKRRVVGRRAYLSYLEGDVATALSLLSHLAGEGGGLTDPDLVHCYIAVLEKVRVQPGAVLENVADGMDICVKSMFSAMSNGLQHEVMGYKISLAHLMRKRGMLASAETIMDSVHKDILKFGCSERTHLQFLLEAGRILLAKKKLVRAYACYVGPCLRRAAALGFRRVEASARRMAITSLRQAQQMAETEGREQWDRIVQQELREDRIYWEKTISVSKGQKERERLGGLPEYEDQGFQNHPRQRATGPFARDPLYAYTIAEAREAILKLSTFGGISRTIAEVDHFDG